MKIEIDDSLLKELHEFVEVEKLTEYSKTRYYMAGHELERNPRKSLQRRAVERAISLAIRKVLKPRNYD